MDELSIEFNDGKSYEKMMGVWSQLVGRDFLNWMLPDPNLRWLDVGCGAGAFTRLIAEHSAPVALSGIDPSPEQIAFARQNSNKLADFQVGDALKLPFPDDSFDVAVMALVIFFLADPGRGVAEMARTVAPGGCVASYAWDSLGGGAPASLISNEVKKNGITIPSVPNGSVSALPALEELWHATGMTEIKSQKIIVTREFESFEAFWKNTWLSPNLMKVREIIPPSIFDKIKADIYQQVCHNKDGSVSTTATANAITGTVTK
tara:strand:+ start:553 stop:1338 length:786 start_codon:yes stop_codon:yes gene_type:complete